VKLREIKVLSNVLSNTVFEVRFCCLLIIIYAIHPSNFRCM